jgi:hypothetical protein
VAHDPLGRALRVRPAGDSTARTCADCRSRSASERWPSWWAVRGPASQSTTTATAPSSSSTPANSSARASCRSGSLALSLRPIQTVGQGQESRSAGGAPRRGRELGALIWRQQRTTKNCFAMPLSRRIYIQRCISKD